jgi:hypothetical protein
MHFCDALHFYVVLCGNLAESIQYENTFSMFPTFLMLIMCCYISAPLY